MPTHTLRLNERDTRRIDLGPEEAMEMAEKGFRFSIFNPASNEFRVSLPHEVLIDRDRGTLTIMQGER